jgi:hypothetical protein
LKFRRSTPTKTRRRRKENAVSGAIVKNMNGWKLKPVVRRENGESANGEIETTEIGSDESVKGTKENFVARPKIATVRTSNKNVKADQSLVTILTSQLVYLQIRSAVLAQLHCRSSTSRRMELAKVATFQIVGSAMPACSSRL